MPPPYLTWGEAAGVEQAREGDIIVFTRGSSTWQGHVAFFLQGQRVARSRCWVATSRTRSPVARYSKARILGIRRPIV